MATWAPKDPSAVLDYVYRIPLDAGDTVSGTPTVDRLSGTVAIDNDPGDLATADTTDEGYGADLTLWLSGGADGETSVFKITWETADGRTPDPAILTLNIQSETEPLDLTGYAKPLSVHLTARYPAFAAVPTSTIAYWLTDAERYVTDVWSEGDYAAGLMALAAHNMALAGYGTDNASLASVPTGVTNLKSGALSVSFTDAAANARATGSYEATRYGQEYLALLRRNRSGPLVGPTGEGPPGADVFVWP